MFSILHDLNVRAPKARIYQAFTDPDQLNKWWTLESSGKPIKGSRYRFYFSDAYDWSAEVETCDPDTSISYRMVHASPEWEGTSFGIHLEENEGSTLVRFSHTGWTHQEAEYRRTSYCWANLLYLLKVWVEDESSIPFDKRDRSS